VAHRRARRAEALSSGQPTHLGRFDLVVDTAVGAGALVGRTIGGEPPALLTVTLLVVVRCGFSAAPQMQIAHASNTEDPSAPVGLCLLLRAIKLPNGQTGRLLHSFDSENCFRARANTEFGVDVAQMSFHSYFADI
jgi:hypothetical protein